MVSSNVEPSRPFRHALAGERCLHKDDHDRQ